MTILRTAQPFARPAKVPPTAADSNRSAMYRVTEIQKDTLRCRSLTRIPAVIDDPSTLEVDETAPARIVEGTTDVIIFRPWLLRETPFHHKERLGEWFDYSGLNVEPRTLRPIPLADPLYVPNHVTRTVFRVGLGRDRNGNPPIERAVERVVPEYSLTPAPTGRGEVSGLEFAAPDIIWAEPIAPASVMIGGNKVSVSWREIDSDRQWYVVSRVEFNATPETP